MKKIVMYNPKNNVKVVTNHQFKSHWEKLGFVVITNVALFSKAG